jgi:hypothetical protein
MRFLRQRAHSLCQAIKQRLRQWTKTNNHTLVLAEKPIRSVIDREKDDLVRGEKGLS